MSFGSQPKADTQAQDRLATVAREMWTDYQERYVPIQDELIGEVGSNEVRQKELRQANENVTSGARHTLSDRKIMTSRYATETDAQRKVAERKHSLSTASSRVAAQNMVRMNLKDRDTSTRAGLISIGRGVADNAVSGMGSLTSMESNRNSANQRLAAGRYASNMNLAGTIAGVGTVAAMAMI